MEGRLVDWIIGFDSLGGTDTFKTPILWKRLEKSGDKKKEFMIHKKTCDTKGLRQWWINLIFCQMS